MATRSDAVAPTAIASPSAWLAGLAGQIGRTPLDDDVAARAARVVVDTVAAVRAGYDDPACASLARRHLAEAADGSCVELFGGRRVGPNVAAFINALPTTVLQIDEGHRGSRAHNAIHVVPAALAVAEAVDATGDRLMAAVVAGYDVATRVSLLIGHTPPRFHNHGMGGAFGAAVAAGLLWDADDRELEAMIDAVASLPVSPWGVPHLAGTTIHHLAVPGGVQLGVLNAEFVLSGATVSPGAFDEFYTSLFHFGTRPWNEPGPEITRNYFKYHAACANAHTSIQAFEALVDEHGFTADDVASIEVSGHAGAYELCSKEVTSNLHARFSIPYLLARILVHGEVGHAVYTEDDLNDPVILDLLIRTSVVHDPELDPGYPAGRPVRVQVVLNDGRVLEQAESMPRGDYQRPVPDATWREKIAALLGGAAAERVVAFCEAEPALWTAREFAAAAAHGLE